MSLAELGVEAAEFAQLYGVTLDDEQAELLREGMSRTKLGRWERPTVANSEARQNGKGETAEARFGYGAVVLNEPVLWTAHEMSTAKDAHRRAVEHFEGCPDIDQQIKRVRWANGEQAIEFRGGGGLFYRSRTDKAGRGLTKISAVMVDEAQHLPRERLAATTPTMAIASEQQRWFGASGGFAHSTVMWDMRIAWILGTGGALLYYEETAETWIINADGDVEFIFPDVEDRANWFKANRALRYGRMTEQFLADQLLTLGPALFAREHLNVWEALPTKGAKNTKLSPDVWAGAVDAVSAVHTGLVLAVDADWDGASACIYVAGRRKDGTRHVGLVEAAPGIGWVETRLAALVQELEADGKRPHKIGYDSTGPAKVLEPVLKKATSGPIELVSMSGGAYAAACAGFVHGVAGGDIWHRGDIETTAAVNAARTRRYGSGEGWIWHGSGGVNISPLRCATVASWLAELVPVRVSAYEDDDALAGV